MITVHLVLNAHIDPVWLWPWQSGLDEVLATCRSACDRLDNHPDIIFTRGEAWAYDIVERTDPDLFARISAHVVTGRWEIVGGWWIQPDCNLPSALGLQRQIELGRDYFQSRFGQFPRIGFNVDSFGHAAALPGLMRRNGQDRYVMMRPQEHEMALPGRLFRWRGKEGGEEVITFRIAHDYATRDITAEHILASLEGLPAGVSHTMCFIGVGDHGGGPTERQVQWCRDRAEAFDGCRLAFSSPSRFFDAVAMDGADLPLVTGELQHHAVGCYSVARAIKTAVRRAEEALAQAEIIIEADPAPEPGTADRLAAAWRNVCFNQFHDTLGGTCIPSAYVQAADQVGAANASADEIVQLGLRRMLRGRPDDRRQRIVLFNASDRAFDGYVTLAPWTEARWRPHWRLLDEDGAAVRHQPFGQEAATAFPRRILLSLKAPPKGLRILTLDRGDDSRPDGEARTVSARATPVTVKGLRLAAASVDFEPAATIRIGGHDLITPRLELYDDPTDTWSHGVDRFDGALVANAEWDAARQIDNGPLMTSAIQRGSIGEADLTAEWRLYEGEPVVELLLQVGWRCAHRLLKLVLPMPLAGRVDGVMGGDLPRDLDGRERPLQDFIWFERAGGCPVGVVCPDVFAVDAAPDGARLTLLRSPLMAHHDPAPAAAFPRATPSDQGLHQFRFQFAAFDGLAPDWLAHRAAMIHRPLIAADLTKGMVARGDW
jgi:alpha-mannosidase